LFTPTEAPTKLLLFTESATAVSNKSSIYIASDSC